MRHRRIVSVNKFVMVNVTLSEYHFQSLFLVNLLKSLSARNTHLPVRSVLCEHECYVSIEIYKHITIVKGSVTAEKKEVEIITCAINSNSKSSIFQYRVRGQDM